MSLAGRGRDESDLVGKTKLYGDWIGVWGGEGGGEQREQIGRGGLGWLEGDVCVRGLVRQAAPSVSYPRPNSHFGMFR